MAIRQLANTQVQVVGMGHNNPPEPTPIEAARETISLLTLESSNWFDGQPIENQAQADCVAKLLSDARNAGKQFDADRKAEKKPHDDAAKAVDAKWKPLIADADRIIECAKKAQTTWLIKQDEAKREIEAAARREAEARAEEARRLATVNDGSLEAAKARDIAIEEAKRADEAAARAARDKAASKFDGMNRSVSLRTVWHFDVDDRRALLNHIALAAPDDLTAFVKEWAAKTVRAGKREIPGVKIWSEKVAA